MNEQQKILDLRKNPLEIRIRENIDLVGGPRPIRSTIARVRGTTDNLWKSLVEFRRQIGSFDTRRFDVSFNLVGNKATVEVPFIDFWKQSVLQGLEHALHSKELNCHYQPIVRSNSTHPAFGYELLARFQDSGNFEISPGELFSLGTDQEMDLQIQRFVLAACVQGVVKVPEPSMAFINVNPELFFQGLVSWDGLLEELRELNCVPKRIVLEVVESDVSYPLDQLVEFSNQCREHGFHVAVDDLGQQCRGLQVVNAVRPDFIKFEMELVTDCSFDRYRRSLLEGIVGTCKRIEATPILEGIEHEIDHRWVSSLENALAQGFYYGRPEPSPAVRAHHPSDKRLPVAAPKMPLGNSTAETAGLSMYLN
ncbi:MAG: EAL domain-containing protein [Pirellulaceae bacterium]